MGELDDAIREHLELKRQHGAREAEVKQLEDEAFGPADRPLDPFTAADEILRESSEPAQSGEPEASTAVATPPDQPVLEEPPAAGEPVLDPLETGTGSPQTTEESAEAKPAPVEPAPAQAEPAPVEDEPAEPKPAAAEPAPATPIPPPPPDPHVREDLAEVIDAPTEEHPAPEPPSDEHASEAPPAPPVPGPDPAPEPPVAPEPQPPAEPEHLPPEEPEPAAEGPGPALYDFESDQHESVDDFAELGPADPGEQPVDDLYRDRGERSEPDAPLSGADHADEGPGAVTADTAEEEILDDNQDVGGGERYQALDDDDEDDYERGSVREGGFDDDDEEEDVLEEKPDFLKDSGDDEDEDDLWFEQRPPQDFDFDDD